MSALLIAVTIWRVDAANDGLAAAEAELVRERSVTIGQLVDQAADAVRAELAQVSTAGDLGSEAFIDAVDRAETVGGSNTSWALLDVDGVGTEVLATVGPEPHWLSELTPDQRAVVAALPGTGNTDLVGIFGTGLFDRTLVAAGGQSPLPGGVGESGSRVVYLEIPLAQSAAGLADPSDPYGLADSPFADVAIGVYVDSLDAAGLALQTAPIDLGRAEITRVPFGSNDLVIAVQATPSLTPVSLRRLPFALAVTGLGATALVAIMLELFARSRRRAASALVDARRRQKALDESRDELRASEQLLRAVVEGAPDLIATVNRRDGIWTLHNSDTVFGNDVGTTVPSETMAGLVHANDRHLFSAFVDTISGGRATGLRDCRVRLSTPSGGEVHVAIRATPRSSEPDVVVFVSDVSDQVASQLEQSRLEEYARQVERLDTVGQLAGGVAHDFNNLLAAITSFSDLLAADIGGERLELVEIRRAAERGAALTSQLLQFSRRGRAEGTDVVVDDLIASLETLLARTLGDDIAFDLQLETDGAVCRLSPTDLENAILNLAVNARDAMPRGGTLRIATRLAGPGELGDGTLNSHVLISVTDDGVGMSPDVKRKAFEPFFTTKGAGKGTGIGLSGVFGLIRQLGGTVALDSTEGAGTTVAMSIPVAVADSLTAAPTRAPDVPLDTDIAAREIHVLLVEDDATVRLAVSRILESVGFTVTVAEHAAEALATYERLTDDIDVMVTDLMMPGGFSGRDLAERLRVRRPDLPVVFVSGYSADVLATRGLDLEGIELVEKPFRPDQLTAAVLRAVDAQPTKVVTDRSR